MDRGWAPAMVAAMLLLASPALATTITRGPYLQQVTTTEATVVFDLAEPAPASVRVESESLGVLEVPSSEPVRHHEVQVRQLEPDQTYRYAVIVPDGEERYRTIPFRTAPEPGTDFSVLVMGDTRSGHDAHRRTIAAMQGEPGRLLINTGDLVADGEEQDQWDTFFAVERSLLERIPLYPIVGNHDTHQGDAEEFREAFALPGTELYYSFDYGSAHFVMLDGHASTDAVCLRGDDLVLNCFDDAQLEWLERDLDEACDRDETRWIFVTIHEGPFSSKADRYGSSQLRELLPLLTEHGVTAVFSGHDHYYERGSTEDGLPYVITGGGGAPLYDLAEPCDFPHSVAVNAMVHHYVVLDITADQVRLTAKALDGTVLDETTFEQIKSCGEAEPDTATPPAESPASDDGCRAAPGTPLRRGAATVLLLGLVASLALRHRRRGQQQRSREA